MTKLLMPLLTSLLATTLVSTAVAEPIVTNGLIANWNLDEASGTAVADYTGNNPGTVYGNPQMAVPGITGTCFQFNGSTDGVSCPNNIEGYGAGSFSFSAWVRTDSSSAPGLVLGCWSASLAFLYITPSGLPAFWLRDQGRNSVQDTGTVLITDGDWHYLVGTRSGSTASLYVDGDLVGTDTNPAFTGNAFNDGAWYSHSWFIGCMNSNGYTYPDENWFNGCIDDVAIYDRALTASEIALNYSAVPEPTSLTTSLTLFIVGAIALLARRRLAAR